MGDQEPNVMAYRLMKLEETVKEQDAQLQKVEKENAALRAEVDGVKTHQKSIEQKLDDQGKKLDEILKRLTEKDLLDAHNKGKFTGGWWVLTGLFTAATTLGAIVASYFQKP